METKTLIKNRLAEGGIVVSEMILNQLVPVYRQWRQYIDETRRIDIPKETEPAHIFSFETLTGADHADRND